ncbi:MAG: site-specific integrase, partial [Bacteroidaceae bacterium]|nr:site-specific integrase [Bacteroidaceae bacterium]
MANLQLRYRQHLSLERSLSRNTIDAYMRDVDKWLTYCEDNG